MQIEVKEATVWVEERADSEFVIRLQQKDPTKQQIILSEKDFEHIRDALELEKRYRKTTEV